MAFGCGVGRTPVADLSSLCPQADRHECRANRQRLGQLQGRFNDVVLLSMKPGFFGEVRARVTFQDGVIQSITVERSETLR